MVGGDFWHEISKIDGKSIPGTDNVMYSDSKLGKTKFVSLAILYY